MRRLELDKQFFEIDFDANTLTVSVKTGSLGGTANLEKETVGLVAPPPLLGVLNNCGAW